MGNLQIFERAVLQLERRVDMPTDLHFVCRQGLNHKRLDPQTFESGNWKVSDDLAQSAVGGRIYLHEVQAEAAWHGGTIISWRPVPGDKGRTVFTYLVEGFFRVKCPGRWGQERAIVRRA